MAICCIGDKASLSQNRGLAHQSPIQLIPHTLSTHVHTSDELIRQVTINCAERGLLLLRVRDEIRMTVAAYQTLYESR